MLLIKLKAEKIYKQTVLLLILLFCLAILSLQDVIAQVTCSGSTVVCANGVTPVCTSTYPSPYCSCYGPKCISQSYYAELQNSGFSCSSVVGRLPTPACPDPEALTYSCNSGYTTCPPNIAPTNPGGLCCLNGCCPSDPTKCKCSTSSQCSPNCTVATTYICDPGFISCPDNMTQGSCCSLAAGCCPSNPTQCKCSNSNECIPNCTATYTCDRGLTICPNNTNSNAICCQDGCCPSDPTKCKCPTNNQCSPNCTEPKLTPQPILPPKQPVPSGTSATIGNFVITPSELVIAIVGIPSNTTGLAIPVTLDTSIITLGSPTSNVSGALAIAGSRSEGVGIIVPEGSTLPASLSITVPLTPVATGASQLLIGGVLNMLGSAGTVILGASASVNTNSIIVTAKTLIPISQSPPQTFQEGCTYVCQNDKVIFTNSNCPLEQGCNPVSIQCQGSTTIIKACEPLTPPSSIILSLLSQNKRGYFKLIAEGTNFNSQSSCSVDASVGALKMNVFPITFNWSSGNHKIIIQVTIPKSLRKFLYKQFGNKVIDVEVSCSNGATGNKSITID